jgi:hypothetical protein
VIRVCRGESAKKLGRKPVDRIGQVFGGLTVLDNLGKRGNDYWFLCCCECDKLVERSYRYLHRVGNGSRNAQCETCATEASAA